MSNSEAPKNKSKTPKNLKSALSGGKNSEKIKDMLKIDNNLDFNFYELLRKNRYEFEGLARDLAKATIGFEDWSDVIDSSPENVHDFIYGKLITTGEMNEEEPDHTDFAKHDYENEVKSNFMEKMEPYYSHGTYTSLRHFEACYKSALNCGFNGTAKSFENYIKKSEDFKDFAQESLTRSTN